MPHLPFSVTKAKPKKSPAKPESEIIKKDRGKRQQSKSI